MITETTDTRPLLSVKDLTVLYESSSGQKLKGTDSVNLTLRKGEALGIVGESGSGKTTLALAIAGLLPPGSSVGGGGVDFDGNALPIENDEQMRSHRWRDISVVFQGAMNALNPVHRIIDQIAEPLILALRQPRKQAYARAGELLELVGIPRDRARSYPHQLSGGMRQRVMIAMALACNPSIVIGDEPTTALDVMTQAQVLLLLNNLRSRLNLSLILITHDLSLVAEACDRVAIMYAGRIVEVGDVASVFERPRHPYTRLLLENVPDLGGQRKLMRPIPGSAPSIHARPKGCAFHPRCPDALPACGEAVPQTRSFGEDQVACHLWELNGKIVAAPGGTN